MQSWRRTLQRNVAQRAVLPHSKVDWMFCVVSRQHCLMRSRWPSTLAQLLRASTLEETQCRTNGDSIPGSKAAEAAQAAQGAAFRRIFLSFCYKRRSAQVCAAVKAMRAHPVVRWMPLL